GASVNEVKLDVRKELGAAKLEISPGNVKYLVGGWSPVGDPVGWGTTIPVLSSEILFPPNPGFDFSKLNTDSLFGKTTKFSTWDPGDSEARVTVNPGSRPYSYTWDFPRDTTQNVTPLTTTGYVVQLVTTDSMVDGQVKILEEKNENDSMPLNVIFNDLPAGDSLQWTWGEFEVNDPDSMMSTIRPSCLLIPPLAQDSIPVSHVETTPANDTTHALSSGDSSLKKMPPGDPGLFELECYPNPSHGPLNIRYTLRTTSDLNIEIYNLEGKMMKHIANDAGLVSGIYLINEDLTSLDDGIYFCRMRCGNDVITQKIILTK
ncbi:MAG TPA: T9SS type A sorting domain-containing protein, partial [Bacteroidia bacterium]